MKYPAVYSYKLSKTRELELSIETLKNIDCWNGEVYVVGDKPDFDGNYTHLPIKYDWGKKVHNRHQDEWCAYITAAEATDRFILMSDDIFILMPYTPKWYNRGELLDQQNSRRLRFDDYSQQLAHTNKWLRSMEASTLSFELHIPYVVQSSHVIQAAEIIPNGNQVAFIRSVLGNLYEKTAGEAKDSKNIDPENAIVYSSDNFTFNYERIKAIYERNRIL